MLQASSPELMRSTSAQAGWYDEPAKSRARHESIRGVLTVAHRSVSDARLRSARRRAAQTCCDASRPAPGTQFRGAGVSFVHPQGWRVAQRESAHGAPSVQVTAPDETDTPGPGTASSSDPTTSSSTSSPPGRTRGRSAERRPRPRSTTSRAAPRSGGRGSRPTPKSPFRTSGRESTSSTRRR